MARRISVSRAARLVGVKRGTLQQKIRSGELNTFEGEILLSDLLHVYPTTKVEDRSMLDRVEPIMEQATIIVGEDNIRSSGNAALAARILAINQDLARQKKLVLDNNNFIAALKSRLNALNDDGTTQEQDSAALLSFYQWCKNAILDWEKMRHKTGNPWAMTFFYHS
ncbi:MAG: hypothetical protein O7D36_03715 [Gammaproteobacteria bacterium]|nr:hypothetical protein [Gammaproteobacteria bacterium]